jgi:rhamnosyltransferase
MINESNFLICIVLYKQALKSSVSFHSLLQTVNKTIHTSILVYDNSETSQTAEIKHQQTATPYLDIHYIHDASNPGVSKAYNTAAVLAAKAKKKWLLFLDQDTTLHQDFFPEALQQINQHPNICLFCPIVQYNNIILSPSRFMLGRSFILPSIIPGIHKAKAYSLINSGLIIQLAAFQQIGGYDEDFKMDYSDHYFIKQFKSHYSTFFVLNCVNQHQLSSFSDTDPAKVLSRYAAYIVSTRLFAAKAKSWLALWWAFLRGLKLTVQYKKLSFLQHATRLFKK